jgi:hypothetical protein
MHENPYAPPATDETVVAIAAEELSRQSLTRRTRPLGLTILAVLHLIGGVQPVVTQLAFVVNFGHQPEFVRAMGYSPLMFLVAATALAVFGSASAIGLWTGARWGWWLGAFYCMYAVFRHLSALWLIASGLGLELATFAPLYIVRAIVALLCFLYFFRANVLAFFGLARLRKLRAAAILVGLCIAVTTVLTLAAELRF